MSDYAKYAHIKVPLSYILGTLDELGDALTRDLLREEEVATEASLKQKLGKVQGLLKARQKIELTYGGSEEEELDVYRGY